MVSSTPRPHFTPGKDPVPILQEAGWAPGPVWTGGKSRLHQDSILDRPARSQSLYRLSYIIYIIYYNNIIIVLQLPTVFSTVTCCTVGCTEFVLSTRSHDDQFAYRRTHFSERFPVVKRRISCTERAIVLLGRDHAVHKCP